MNDTGLTMPEQMQDNMLYHQQANELISKVILDNDAILDEFVRTLKGIHIDEKTNEITKYGKPIISEGAINWLRGRLTPYTSKIFALSNLNEKDINTMIFEYEADLITELMVPESLEVDRKHRNFVKGAVLHPFTATIKKALGMQTANKLLVQHSVSESSIKSQQQKAGLFNRGQNQMDVGLV